MTATESPCNPVLGLGPGGCAIFTAEVDSITQTDPQNNLHPSSLPQENNHLHFSLLLRDKILHSPPCLHSPQLSIFI